MSEEQDNPKKKINWTPEKVMSSSAVVISLVSLIALFYQLNLAREENELIRKQQSAGVLPHLSFDYATSSQQYQITIVNKGVGPAFVTEAEFVLNGTEKFKRSDLLFNRISEIIKTNEGVRTVASTYSFQKGDVIPANQELDILTTRGETQTTLFLKYMDTVDWDYSVIYEDIYGAQWKLSRENIFPVPVKK